MTLSGIALRYLLMSESASKVYLEGDSDTKLTHGMGQLYVIALYAFLSLSAVKRLRALLRGPLAS